MFQTNPGQECFVRNLTCFSGVNCLQCSFVNIQFNLALLHLLGVTPHTWYLSTLGYRVNEMKCKSYKSLSFFIVLNCTHTQSPQCDDKILCYGRVPTMSQLSREGREQRPAGAADTKRRKRKKVRKKWEEREIREWRVESLSLIHYLGRRPNKVREWNRPKRDERAELIDDRAQLWP